MEAAIYAIIKSISPKKLVSGDCVTRITLEIDNLDSASMKSLYELQQSNEQVLIGFKK